MTSLVIISGLSGSGKSTAVNVLEDLGYYCVDNLPLTLLPKFIELCDNSEKDIQKVALVIDIREGIFLDRAPELIREFKDRGYPLDIIFLDSSEETLIKRYKETRRKHPLSSDGNISEGISRERDKLREIKNLSDLTIDTSEYNVHDLRELIRDNFDRPDSQRLSLNIFSFGHKHGFPNEADMVFDVRFLPNPHFVEELKELDGRSDEVIEYVLENEITKEYLQKLKGFLEYLIPKYDKEGKSYLTIAIGCTGGKHRSVAIVDTLSQHFKHLSPKIRHRDILKK